MVFVGVHGRPVLPAESAATQFRFPSPSWDARLGCPAGTYADGTLQVPTQCTPCQEGRRRGKRGGKRLDKT